MGLTNGRSQGVGVRSVVLGAIGYGGTAMCVTLMFLAMRAVMDIGGSCADGGPYVSAQSCPEGSAVALLLGIFGLFLFGTIASIAGIRIGGIWAGAPAYAWAALFGALGWNFLDYGLFNAPAETGIDWGWVLCGVVFWIMAVGPLMGAVPLLAGLGIVGRGGGDGARPLKGPGRPGWRPPAAYNGLGAASLATGAAVATVDAADSPEDVRHELAEIATDFGVVVGQATAELPADPVARRATAQAAGAVSAGAERPDFTEGTQALLDRLERLADMRDRGLLAPEEYETTKAAIMAELEGRT